MLIFLICALPLLSFYVFSKTLQRRFYILYSCCGFGVAALLCTYNQLFSFYTSITVSSLFHAFMYFFVHFNLLPHLICGGLLYVIITAPVRTKLDVYLPFFIAFYAVSMPYHVIAVAEDFTVYLLFCKPILYGCMLLCTSSMLRLLYRCIEEKANRKTIAIVCAMLFAALAIPSLVEALWVCATAYIAWIIAFCLYIILCLVAVLKLGAVK